MADKTLIFKKSKLSDVYDLARRLREDDKLETIAAGSNPLKSLKDGVVLSTECISVYTSNNLLIGMYGYRKIAEDLAIIWFLGSDEIENYPFSFIKGGKQFIKKLEKDYTLFNYVWSENETHIKYIQTLGLTVDFENPILFNNETFYKFYKLRSE